MKWEVNFTLRNFFLLQRLLKFFLIYKPLCYDFDEISHIDEHHKNAFMTIKYILINESTKQRRSIYAEIKSTIMLRKEKSSKYEKKSNCNCKIRLKIARNLLILEINVVVLSLC